MPSMIDKVEFNFVHKSMSDADVDLMLGPLDPTNVNDDIIRFDDDTKLEDIAVRLNVFPSKTQARKNGWEGEIPPGFSTRHFSKKQKTAFFLNRID